MSRRRNVVAVMACSCLALVALAGETVVPALAASTASTPTAPQQLVHQYPLGPQRLCCNGQAGLSGTTASSTPTRSTPPAPGSSAPGRARTPSKPVGRGASGGDASAALLIGFVVLALLIIAGAATVYRTRRRPAPVLGHGSLSRTPSPYANGAVPGTSVDTDTITARAGPAWERSPVPSVGASEAEEREFRRLDAAGDAGGAFNLGVVLHQRGDDQGAKAAYERAEQRGDPDAAFNLGVLYYESGELDLAEGAWQRSAGRGHVRAAANLLFLSRYRRRAERRIPVEPDAPGLAEFEELSYRRADQSGAAAGAFNLGVMLHQQGDTAGAVAAYERAERRGDPDAAFNLGVLLYEVGDLDGAEAAWRRSAERGDVAAAENLDFLLRHRHELETAGVAGEEGEER